MTILTCSLDLTCHILSGEIKFEEFVERVISFYETNPTANVLWDLRDATCVTMKTV